jgi:small conductance mechanosensitive channel
MDTSLSTLEQIRNTAIDLAVRFGPRLLAALAVIGAGVIISRWAGRLLTRALERLDLEPPVRSLLARIGRGAVLALFLIMSLQNLGVELLPLIAGLGVIGAGVALAMQGVLSDVAAGLSIIFTKPFRVGEYISIAGEEGTVADVTLLNTVLAHVDESRVVIPNRKIVGEILHNFGRIRQLEIIVGVSYDVDFAAAEAAINEVLRGNPRLLRNPPPLVLTARLTSSCVEMAIKPWVLISDYAAATSEINEAVVETFRNRGIRFPLPQCEVQLIPGVSGLHPNRERLSA